MLMTQFILPIVCFDSLTLTCSNTMAGITPCMSDARLNGCASHTARLICKLTKG